MGLAGQALDPSSEMQVFSLRKSWKEKLERKAGIKAGVRSFIVRISLLITKRQLLFIMKDLALIFADFIDTTASSDFQGRCPQKHKRLGLCG